MLCHSFRNIDTLEKKFKETFVFLSRLGIAHSSMALRSLLRKFKEIFVIRSFNPNIHNGMRFLWPTSGGNKMFPNIKIYKNKMFANTKFLGFVMSANILFVI